MYYVSLTGIEAVKGIKGQNMPTNSNVITFKRGCHISKKQIHSEKPKPRTPLRSLAFLMMGHTKIEPAPGFGLI